TAILRHGITDMGDVTATATPSQMMAMALETVYQGLGLKRAVAFMHNYKDGKYVGKISFGAGMHAMVPHLVFDESRHPDVFHAALASDKIIFIEHAKEHDFAAKLPHWWLATLQTAQSFIIVPLALAGHPAGFIYGDWMDEVAPFVLTENEYLLLNEVRARVVHSLERRRQAIANSAATKATVAKSR
ncbi:MAG: GAF domain-containing protein, partial [Burkholderiales bacterium]|nr:GAF domain-containing protein [Burkholderiales bacterium]